MKLSTTGHVIHFYFVSGKRLTKAVLILGILLVLSCALVLTIPEFSLHRPGFRISSSPILAIAQVAVGTVLLGSMAGGALLGVFVLFWFWPEILCEVALRRRALRIVRTRKTILLSDLAQEVGVYEDELGILLKHWVAARAGPRLDPTKGTLSGGHLRLHVPSRMVFWDE
jgi:hypothetical protein